MITDRASNTISITIKVPDEDRVSKLAPIATPLTLGFRVIEQRAPRGETMLGEIFKTIFDGSESTHCFNVQSNCTSITIESYVQRGPELEPRYVGASTFFSELPERVPRSFELDFSPIEDFYFQADAVSV